MVISVPTTFLTSFTTPYLIGSEYANLGGKLGYVYGVINVLVVVGVFFVVPELKDRSLEKVDQMFTTKAALRKLKHFPPKIPEEMCRGKETEKVHVEVVSK